MRYSCLLALVVLALVLAADVPTCLAQVIVIDDVILLSRTANNREEARTHEHLEPTGTLDRLPPMPGADEPKLEQSSRIGPRLHTTTYQERQAGQEQRPERPPIVQPRQPLGGPPAAFSGPLELPEQEDEGPADGLPLDEAIECLLASNYDLRTRFQELPKADADLLSAGLRNNPFLFLSADAIPYGSFSPRRPGATTYDITMIQPIDVSGKRRNRILVAQQAKRILEAQYQDSVRKEIDRLYTAYVDVLESRQAARAAAASNRRARELAQTARDLSQRGVRTDVDVSEALLRQFDAETAQHTAEVALLQAKRNLATLLAIPAEYADRLEIRDSLHDRAPAPPCTEALIELAVRVRPDVAAHQMGVERARADVRLKHSEGLEDVFLFYTPFTGSDYTPQGKQFAGGWGLGVLMPIPILNRNQGNIARARINVVQTQLELENLRRRIANEVQNAVTEYVSSGEAVRRYEQEGLPAIGRLRDDKLRRYAEGKESLDAYLTIQKNYSEMVRRYLTALVRHRRGMLKLNTIVGQRLLP